MGGAPVITFTMTAFGVVHRNLDRIVLERKLVLLSKEISKKQTVFTRTSIARGKREDKRKEDN